MTVTSEERHLHKILNRLQLSINGHKQKAKRESGCDTEILFSVHMM
ncbi:hypothetical protein [Symbiopectobacterium sp. RP]